MTDAGSAAAAGGTSTIPAPMELVRRLVVREVPPRREPEERADPVTSVPVVAPPGLGVEGAAADAGAAGGAAAALAAGAFTGRLAGAALVPQVSQYPSAATRPVQPGSVQLGPLVICGLPGRWR